MDCNPLTDQDQPLFSKRYNHNLYPCLIKSSCDGEDIPQALYIPPCQPAQFMDIGFNDVGFGLKTQPQGFIIGIQDGLAPLIDDYFYGPGDVYALPARIGSLNLYAVQVIKF